MSELTAQRAGRRLTADILFVGLTRPAMAFGVPYVAVLGNMLVTLELFLVTRNLLWLLTAIPLHALTFLVCLVEPRFFDLLQVWAVTRSRARFADRNRWGARTYGALSVGPRRTSRGVPFVPLREAP